MKIEIIQISFILISVGALLFAIANLININNMKNDNRISKKDMISFKTVICLFKNKLTGTLSIIGWILVVVGLIILSKSN